jgi:hypothetical protein
LVWCSKAPALFLLKKGMTEVGELKTVNLQEIARAVRTGLANPQILLGVFFEALFFR